MQQFGEAPAARSTIAFRLDAALRVLRPRLPVSPARHVETDGKFSQYLPVGPQPPDRVKVADRGHDCPRIPVAIDQFP
jgi:hypothetical protein